MAIRFSLFAALLLTPFSAFALNLPALPTGMCALDEAVPEQAVVIHFLKDANVGSNEVVTSFAACDELTAMKNKKANGLRHYGAVLSQALGEPIPLDRASYVASAASLLKSSSVLTDTALTTARESVAEASAEDDLSNPRSMQATPAKVLFQNETMLILGTTQTNIIGGRSIAVASTAAMTLIDGTPVSINLYAPVSAHDQAFTDASAALKPYVTRLIAANP